MSKKIVLIGGGGHCRSVLDTLLRNGDYRDIVITDNNVPEGTKISGCNVVGNDYILSELLEDGYEYAFITVGSLESTRPRRFLFSKACELGFDIPAVIDRSAVVSEYAKLGNGVFVGKNAVVNAEAVIGDCAIINTGAIVEHECSVGEFTHISVGAKLCGNVIVGSDCLVGAGATVIQGIKIGSNAVIGAGSTVIRDIESSTVNVGLVK